MWKTIISVILFVSIGTPNLYAAGLEANNRITSRDRSERNVMLDQRMSFNNMMNSLNISEDVSAGFVFGLDKTETPPNDGPENNKKGFGIGFGLSFSF